MHIPQSYVDAHWQDNPPTSFTVGSDQHDSSGGQWTSLGSTDNSANYINDLIWGTETPAYLSTGGQVYIQNGEKGAIYNTVSAQFAAQPDHIYMVPVVQDGFSNGAWANITSFVPYQITGCSGSGNNCYVTATSSRAMLIPPAPASRGNIPAILERATLLWLISPAGQGKPGLSVSRKEAKPQLAAPIILRGPQDA